ncbi:MAG: TonB-dependent receptor [Ferruginibacter sp.]|nr:TonB-dependent receptor [Ferruginibacter sp.]
MQRTIILLSCVLAMTIVDAQSKLANAIIGSVKDSASQRALEYATISLYTQGAKKPLSGTVTDKDGDFILKDVKEGVYTIVFEFIGYRPFTMNKVKIENGNSALNIKTVFLLQQSNNLQGVTVIAKNNLVENKIDKMVFNAEKDITSQSGVATDVLKKIPQVSVDADGNVQLAGSSGVRFLINGKPSTAFGSGIADVLQSIPASQIKRIEVVTNPGAKYDAQGLGGIINIILKTNSAKGYNGNLSLTGGTRMENGSFNLNARNNNFGVNAFVGGNKRLSSKTPFISERLTTDSNTTTTLLQAGLGKFERHGLQAGGGFDWTYKKLNSFSGSFSYNDFGNTGGGYTNQTLQVNNGGITPPVLSIINAENVNRFKNIDASVNYKRTFQTDDQALEFSINTSAGKSYNTFGNVQLLLPQDSLFYGSRSSNPANTKETEINIDYTQPLNKDVTIGVGGKASFYNVASRSVVFRYQPESNDFIFNPSLANDLSYQQKVYAVYSEISFPVWSFFTAKLGGRYERTEINSYYSNAQAQAKTPGYNTLVPSVFFMKKIGDEQTLKLSYSKRIERPDYNDLNPFVNTNDPKNLYAGNPYLVPEIGKRIELSYSREIDKSGSVMANLFYRINDHDIQPYVTYYPTYKAGDSIYTVVAVTSRQNIGMEKNFGVNLFADMHITSKLTLRGNLFVFRRHTINTLDKGFNSNSFNYRFNINATYQFTNTMTAEFFGNFNSARHEAQGIYPSFTSYSVAMRKQFWNKKGSLALTANNFINEYVVQKTVLFGPVFSVNSTRKIPFRSIGINFTWKFGKLEFKKNKPESDPNNSTGE